MIHFDKTHPDVRRAIDRVLLNYLQQGLNDGRSGVETVYVDAYRSFKTINWDRLRLKYAPLKAAQPFHPQTGTNAYGDVDVQSSP